MEVYCKNEVLKLSSNEEAKPNKIAKETDENQFNESNAEQAKNASMVLRVNLQNSTLIGAVTLCHAKLWEGTFMHGPGSTIDKNGWSFFGHVFPIVEGCKAAVVYVGKNERNQDCGWLLAWKLTTPFRYQLYAQCGLSTGFDNINWSEIEKQLEGETSTGVSVRDSATNTQVIADIEVGDMKVRLRSIFSG